MATLILKDDVDSVTFINTPANSGTYRYLENTFETQIPERKEIRTDLLYGFGRDLLSLSYRNRSIRFQFLVVGSTDSVVQAAITKISRMLIRAQDPIYLNGGGYSDTLTSAEGLNTGDNGLILRYKLRSSTEGTIENELGANVTGQNILTYKVISGDLRVIDQVSSGRKMGNDYVATCELILETDPFGLAEARILAKATGDGFYGVGTAPDIDNRHNRFHIPAASIPGDAPALTRIYTNLQNALGIIIGRDAGISLLNSTSFPAFTGTGLNDCFVWGQKRANASNSYFRIKITGTGTPNQFAWSANDGSTWSSNIAITARTPIQLSGTDTWVYFVNSTGHTLNDYWRFMDHQTYINGTTAIDIYSNRESFYAMGGGTFSTTSFTIPKGCHSRYKIYADINISGVQYYEVSMGIAYYTLAGTSVAATEDIQYDWIKPESDSILVDMGMIDLSPKSSPFMLQPGAFSYGKITLKLRAISNISSPGSAKLDYILFVPAQDDNSYMHAAWDYDSASGREVYCNFDPNNPYLAEVDANHFTTGYNGSSSVAGLDFTMAGNVITLIPGVDNTIVFFPLLVATGNWRGAQATAGGHTGETSLAIRPRYLFGG